MSAPAVRKGGHDASQLRVGIVVARFNSLVTDSLLQGALKALHENGCPTENIEVLQVPGAVELPLMVAALADRRSFDALIALGAIVRGETQHHHYISQAVVDALQQIGLQQRLPIALGVLTTENMAQALQRAAADPGNKGHEAALTAIECANLLKQLGSL
ncbi:MAG TPA: 6,7-dimethyl-8-ribityllumazine synthase [Terriglobales bacterium]|nr:6,7-dimethyl-8-ribityllumazine synthase [Terriglobales bacterium]